MSEMSQDLETALIDYLLRGVDHDPPETLYLALGDGPPSEDGTFADEFSGGNYERQVVTFTGLQSDSSTTRIKNGNVVRFPIAHEDWGYASDFGIFDAVSGGEMLAYGINFSSETWIGAGDSLLIPELELVLELAGSGGTEYLHQGIFNLVFLGGALTKPNIHIALYSAAPTYTTAGTQLSGGGYNRVQHTSWDAPTSTGANQMETFNDGKITFPQASTDWTTAAYGLLDAADGNLLFYYEAGDFVGSGDTGEFADGAINISIG